MISTALWGRCTVTPNGKGREAYCTPRPIHHFSRRTPLNGVPSFFPSMNRPVLVSRFVQVCVFGLRTCERSLTAPIRRLSPLGGLVAISVSVSSYGRPGCNNSSRSTAGRSSWLREQRERKIRTRRDTSDSREQAGKSRRNGEPHGPHSPVHSYSHSSWPSGPPRFRFKIAWEAIVKSTISITITILALSIAIVILSSEKSPSTRGASLVRDFWGKAPNPQN